MKSHRSALWKWLRQFSNQTKLRALQYQWYKRNTHNETTPCNLFNLNKVTVGNYSYGNLYVVDGNGTSNLTIGAYCSIAENVTFILNGEHPANRIVTFPLHTFVLGEAEIAGSHGDIVIEDDVWIGHGATILSGVRIAQGSIVAAGAVVTRDVEPYSIVAGVPARVAKHRFPPELRAELIQTNLVSLIAQHDIKDFDKPLTLEQLVSWKCLPYEQWSRE